jgi:hypothetical protein
MTRRASERACEKALAALTREAADLPLPDLDWERIEAKVLSAVEIAPVATKVAPRVSVARWVPSPPTWVSTPWPMAVAAAAAAALIYGSPTGAPRAPREPEEALTAVTRTGSPARNLASLEVGDVARTDGRSAVYDKAGVVRFALAPNSRIEVVANDIDEQRAGGMTVALLEGSLHADVKPRTEGEVFAVEVERTRIAVHGTSFTVVREGDRVIVDVAHGSVAVGPVGYRGSTHGWLVVGPDRAVFSLDGARQATWLGAAPEAASAAIEPVVEPPPATVSGASASRGKRPLAAATTRVETTAGSTKGEVAASSVGAPRVTAWGSGAIVEGHDPSEQEASEMAAILRQLETCYEKQVSSFGVRFSVESSLKLTILPSGAIREGVFTPPLSPTLMSCANKAIGAAHFPGGESARQIRIPVQLSRAPR